MDGVVCFVIIVILVYFGFDGVWVGLDLCCFLIRLLLFLIFSSINISVDMIVIVFIVIKV